jgi:hypothetical protein
MKKHLSLETLTEIVIKREWIEEGEIHDHLEACQSCRNSLVSLERILSPSGNRALFPSPEVEKRILASFNESKPGKPAGLKQTRRRALAAALITGAASAAAAVIFLVFTPFHKPALTAPVKISDSNGDLFINDIRASGKAMAETGSLLCTGRDSSVRISHENHFSIILAPDSRLLIKESRFDAGKNTLIFAFVLSHGRVYGEFNHTGVKLNYSFETPQARMDSIGTKFLLSTDGEKTELVLTEGSLDIRSFRENSILRAESGKTYEVTAKIAASPSSERQRREIDSVRNRPIRKPGAKTFSGDARERRPELPAESVKADNLSAIPGGIPDERMTEGRPHIPEDASRPESFNPDEGKPERRFDFDRMKNERRRPQENPLPTE